MSLLKKTFLVCVFLPLLFFCGEKKKRETIVIYVPATPASIPVLIAGSQMPNTSCVVFKNHSQAHQLFLNKEVDILFTGLSVGLIFFEKNLQIRILNSYVTGVTHLLTYGNKISNFSQLKGKTIIVPFENSPIDELTRFFIEREGLVYGKDIKVAYALPNGAKALLESGKNQAAPLPEPLVSVLLSKPGPVKYSFSYYDYYNKIAQNAKGYPQVAALLRADFSGEKKEYLEKLNYELRAAIQLTRENPDEAVRLTINQFGLSAEIMKKALARSVFHFNSSDSLAREVYEYYRTIGKPLPEKTREIFLAIP